MIDLKEVAFVLGGLTFASYILRFFRGDGGGDVGLGTYIAWCIVMSGTFLITRTMYNITSVEQLEKRYKKHDEAVAADRWGTLTADSSGSRSLFPPPAVPPPLPTEFYFDFCILDEYIPFNAHWIWIYIVPIYASFMSILAGASTSGEIVLIMLDTLILYTFQYWIWSMVPSMIHPKLQKDKRVRFVGDISYDMLALFQRYDGQGTNAAPSVHCSLTALYCSILGSAFDSWIPLLWVPLVVMSCMGTKQHVFLDCLSGVGLGVIVYGIHCIFGW